MPEWVERDEDGIETKHKAFFSGIHYYTLAKPENRVLLPSGYVKIFKKLDFSYCRGFSTDCILIMETARLDKLLDEIAARLPLTDPQAQIYLTRLTSSVKRVLKVDSTNRITLPDYLVELAHLNEKADNVLVAGKREYLEIWNRELWEELAQVPIGEQSLYNQKNYGITVPVCSPSVDVSSAGSAC
jgi:DNA-binding transcriptional regulator/RsmH inhibitor MraZ